MFSKFSEDNGRAFQAEPFSLRYRASNLWHREKRAESLAVFAAYNNLRVLPLFLIPMLIQGPNYFDPGEHGMNFEFQKDIKCHLKIETFAGLVKI